MVQWYKGDKEIRRSPKYEFIDDGRTHKLVIKDVDGHDEADYSVMAKDSRSKGKLTIHGREMY